MPWRYIISRTTRPSFPAYRFLLSSRFDSKCIEAWPLQVLSLHISCSRSSLNGGGCRESVIISSKMPKSMLHLCIIVSSWPASGEVTSHASLMASIKISRIVWSQTEFTCSLNFLQNGKKESFATYLFYQSNNYINYWRKWVSMKRWTVSLFRGLPRRRSTCCQCAIIKSEYVKFVMHKKTMLIFWATQKWNFTFFWHVVILLLSCRIKIHHHDITVLKAQNKNLVLQKKTLCLKKSWFCPKSKVVSTKAS